MFKNTIIAIGIFAALFAVLVFSGRIPLGKKDTAITGSVVIWGTLPETQMIPFFQSFNTKAKTYTVTYYYVGEDVFENKLLNELSSGRGPDMILAPYQVILSQSERILPFPKETLPVDTYKNAYVDGASIFLTENGSLALPVSIEPLLLMYNRSLFAKHAVISPPVAWDEITSLAPLLTTLDKDGNWKEHAVALGLFSNVLYAKDIMMTLVSQLGQIPVLRENLSGVTQYTVLVNAPVTTESEVIPLATSIRFFTDFANPQKVTYTWNAKSASSLDEFTTEKLAMYIGYYSDIEEIKNKNSRLDFGVTMLPQAKGYNTSVTGMKLLGLATLKRTQNTLTTQTVQSLLAGNTYGKELAQYAGGMSPLRAVIANDNTTSDAIRKSVLIARGWYDMHSRQSSSLLQSMLSDIQTGRATIQEATNDFGTRLQELYSQ